MLAKQNLLVILTLLLAFQSCTRKDIEFGSIPETGYTNLVYIDTVGISFSTVVRDSFVTSSASSLLLGRYRDPYLGTISARSFFQLGLPVTLPEIPATAVFDSISFVVRPNDYYYGDTSKQQTLQVFELDQTIVPTYGSLLFNTSSIPVKPVPLGAKQVRLHPLAFDSLVLRLDDAKGLELFARLRSVAEELASETAFQNYFKGISLAFSNQDTSAVYGLSGEDGVMVMRLHYHHTIPYPEAHIIDFPSRANALAFYQCVADRSGTALATAANAELPSTLTGNLSFLQPGTGLHLKMSFPSLRTILTDKALVKLLKAELIIRPAYLSFDRNKYKLPSKLYLATTDASNIMGSTLADSTGSTELFSTPNIDDIYGENTYYRFNVTNYIGSLLLTPGTERNGLFITETASSDSANTDRLIVNDALSGKISSRLALSVLIINK